MSHRQQSENALKEAEAAFENAQKYLDEMKSKIGSAAGTLWWMNRDLLEARKYLPQRAGGIAKK
jgi:hypothetical protein